ncbi:MAG: Na(+)-translocating NADH-quinone reductase subunit A [Pseudohongiellaceae bacterium]
MKIKLDKGFDVPIANLPEQVIDPGPSLSTLAMLGTDYLGLKPKVLVQPGQVVAAGEPLFLDKHNPEVNYSAPGTGRVVAVNRGRRRALQSIVIELDETAAVEHSFEPVLSNDPAVIRKLLLQSGAWTSFRTRPFNRVPKATSNPCAIFITAVDTRPLAADPNLVIAQGLQQFEKGMEIIAQFGQRPVFLCTGADWPAPEPSLQGVKRVEFSGPHPAGLPGTHIHFLNPAGAERTVWHINYQDVIAIGHLFETGRILTERIVSVGGPGALNPRLLRTRLGANLDELLKNEIDPAHSYQIISGSVLDGSLTQQDTPFLRRYDNQVSLLADQTTPRWFDWLRVGADKVQFSKLLNLTQHQRYELSTARNGRRVAMIPTDAFERVMPLDILPVPLLRALLVRDTDVGRALGCMELAEEDLALISFVCPAKQDYGAVLRANLDQIEKEG